MLGSLIFLIDFIDISERFSGNGVTTNGRTVGVSPSADVRGAGEEAQDEADRG